MTKPCSLHTVRVKVLRGFRVPLLTPGISGIELMIDVTHGELPCSITPDGWMLVHLFEDKVVGLPLEGDRLSWEDAWGHPRIVIEVCTPDGWEEVEDWDAFVTRFMRA